MRTVALIAAAGAAYYVSGRLGLLLAIPPGYASAVWPASGIALAAVLLGGARTLPGVWLGSFLINASMAVDASAPIQSLFVPAAIGAGAAAQALLGAWLVRRHVRHLNVLAQELGVVHMLLLGGPVACVVSAAIGVTTLWLAGTLSAGAVWINAWTWWVGDSIGVLVFTPLVLVWAVRPYRLWLRRQLFVTLPMVAMLATVVALFVFVSQREQARIREGFEADAAELGRELEKDLSGVMAALGALEGFYASSERVEGYEFEIFASRLLHVLPAARGLSWNPVVPHERRAAFERRTGRPIVERSGEELGPAAARPSYVPVEHMVPRLGNERVLGFDSRSDPGRRAALEKARDTGRVVATARVPLVQAPGQPGMLAFMPVYRHGVQPTTVSGRRRYLDGYVVATFDLDRLMVASATAALDAGLLLALYDDSDPGGPQLLYEESRASGPGPAALREEFRFQFAGRLLRLRLELREQMLVAHRSWETWLVLAAGLGLVSLLGMLLLLGVGREARVAALVDERTAELRRLNADLGAEVARRSRLEAEAARRAGELAEFNEELQRRAEVNRQLLASLRSSESELRRTATQLASSNRELEQFAYVASHDLKAPLRSIGSFAQLLERRHGEALGKDAAEFLRFIQDGIHQMQALIDDLLQLSRVDARRLEPAMVAMGEVVDRACRALTADLKSSGAVLHVGPLPAVHADANMLVQLLQNLIGNAVKFQKRGTRPEIRIDAVAEGDQWHFTVRDNGIGIEPAHLEQIFMVFKRLHTTEQYPGNGIGLAVCKKVVALHGGEIWAESTPGKGTTFHFTLPRAAA
jgi:signal transduction histidine kinase